MSDFLRCPRAYYLGHVYKDPKTNHKIKIMSPPLALGSAVHEVLESLSVLPKEQRFSESLITKFDAVWEKFTGKKGGFTDPDAEYKYKLRGQEMLRRVYNNPGPLSCLAVKIQADLPYFWLSEEDNIILCGRIDWLEYLPESDSVHIIDFKTGKQAADSGSLQLPIYSLLTANCQSRPASKASYWYLAQEHGLLEQDLPDPEESHATILEIAKKVKLARQLERFVCPKGDDGCYACRPLEAIVAGDAEFVGVGEFNYDTYILPQQQQTEEMESVIL